MMRSVLMVFLFAGLVLLNSCYHPSPQQAFSDLEFLEGTWKSYEGVKFNESWDKVNDSLIKGIGYSLNGLDTVFSEQLILKRNGDSIYYGALVSENEEFVYFKLEKAGRNHWIFKNPTHNYPNIIKYKLKNDTLLEATTTNLRGNKKIVFKLKKV